jgi:hypothetical protein
MAEDMGRDDQRDWGGNTGSLGGYGSAGLYSRRRQMERTTGGSYLHQSDVASGSSGGGGYVSMPSRGPNPIVKSMPEGKRSAPIMPATVKGVAPNFNVKPPSVPNWGAMGGVASVIGAAGGAFVGRALGRRGQGEEEQKKTAVEEVTEFVKENKYDPNLGGSGVDLDAINAQIGLLSVRAQGELGPAKGRMDTSESVTPVDVSQVSGTMQISGTGAERLNAARDLYNETASTPDGSPFASGSQRAVGPTSTRTTNRNSSTDEEQAARVGQTRSGTPMSPGTRSSAQSEEAALQAAQAGADRDRQRVSDEASDFSNPGHKERSGDKNRRSGTPK